MKPDDPAEKAVVIIEYPGGKIMIEIIKPTITKEVDENGRYGKFVIEPLERGYGTTLGNCMRRVLLSSLPGAAITSVKIDGILHEFSTIPGQSGLTEMMTEERSSMPLVRAKSRPETSS